MTLVTAVPVVKARAGLLPLIERRLGITTSGLLVVVVSALGWLLASKLASQGLFVLAFALLFVCISAYLLAAKRLAITTTRSHLPPRIREGQVVPVRILLTARRRVSTIVLEEEVHPQLGSAVRVPIANLGKGDEVEHEYAFAPKLRGVYPVGPLTATWTDPFGLVRKRVTLADPESVIVHPRVERVDDRVLSRAWEDPPIRPPVSRPWPTGFDFYGMREYSPGDDPRRMVWRAVARTGKYLVRESEQGITDAVSIVMDTDAAWHTHTSPSESFELSVRTVASLAAHHLREGFSVTVQTNERVLADSVRSARHRIAVLDSMAQVQPSAEPFEAALRRILQDRRRDTHMVIVTPYLTPEAARLLRVLSKRGVSLLLVLVVGDDPEPDLLHRAGTLGVNVVEVNGHVPLERSFTHVMAARVSKR